ncbi:hypothetical protein ON010_g6166 [Phytophthora cinnamomi]|nr:hypothetical protein ON010_g6166 [Phytophthora cinnamomi]
MKINKEACAVLTGLDQSWTDFGPAFRYDTLLRDFPIVNGIEKLSTSIIELITTTTEMILSTRGLRPTQISSRQEQEASAETKPRRDQAQASTGVGDLPSRDVIRVVRTGASLDGRRTEETTAEREAACRLDQAWTGSPLQLSWVWEEELRDFPVLTTQIDYWKDRHGMKKVVWSPWKQFFMDRYARDNASDASLCFTNSIRTMCYDLGLPNIVTLPMWYDFEVRNP